MALGHGELSNDLRAFAVGSAFRPPDPTIPGVDAAGQAERWELVRPVASEQANGFGLPAGEEGAATVEYAQRFRLARLKGWQGTLDDNERGAMLEQSNGR